MNPGPFGQPANHVAAFSKMSAPMMSTGVLRQLLRSRRQLLKLPEIERKYQSRSSFAIVQGRNSSSYCLELVRKYDYENFLCTLLLPSHARAGAIAVRAFNVELARVRDTVSETQIGLMRLQFWLDAVDKTFSGAPPEQPVAAELYKATQRHRISKGWLKRLVESRNQSLSSQPFDSIRAMEEYSVNTVSPVNYLVLQCLDLGLSVDSEHLQLVSRLGRAQGLSSLLRSTARLAPRRICYLPSDLMARHAVKSDRLWRGMDDPAIREVAFEVASAANRHLEHVKENLSKVPREARSAFLPGVAVASYLRRLQRADFNLFHPALQQRDGWLPARLWWRNWRGTL
ncbi:NADH dehydrogenase (ubiquinone) complex I, assembly factor 6-like [Amphibalanus amphitrite]|uniref:NADH dehydrogenase (ubiquinone) complex I, assembly factor 6-like n=1 Tax=Amphibalanus amphitrite TaxID=1232801 RepID=UPI001C917121|nr:NADH dehydrogenase (ubiquinone) complex I, assembly factor 6-like [Amphibalanus amphitrite]